jgi:ketosteroid isomerase-like protein
MTSQSDDDVGKALADLVSDYDKYWSSLDFACLADLWERDVPQPIYLGEEYATPLVGSDDLDRHWARVAGRVKTASMSSTLHAFDVVDGDVVRAVLLSRWRLTGRESDFEHTGASWITWLLIRRAERYRIFHQMESQVYLTESEGQ